MKRFYAIAIAVTVAAALSTGCATKKYVQQTVSPVQAKVDDSRHQTPTTRPGRLHRRGGEGRIAGG